MIDPRSSKGEDISLRPCQYNRWIERCRVFRKDFETSTSQYLVYEVFNFVAIEIQHVNDRRQCLALDRKFLPRSQWITTNLVIGDKYVETRKSTGNKDGYVLCLSIQLKGKLRFKRNSCSKYTWNHCFRDNSFLDSPLVEINNFFDRSNDYWTFEIANLFYREFEKLEFLFN